MSRAAGRGVSTAAARLLVFAALLGSLLGVPSASAQTDGGSALTVDKVEAAELGPLAPIVADSPRATLEGFVAHARTMEQRYIAYRLDKTRGKARRIGATLERLRHLFDLSQVSPATRQSVGRSAVIDLFDVLIRLPDLDIAAAPSADDGEPPARWRLPGTEIVIARQQDGPRAGEYLFTAETVEMLSVFRDRVAGMPAINAVVYSDWRREQMLFTGPAIPYALAAAVPRPLQTVVLGSPVWKTMATAAAVMLGLALSALWTWGVRRTVREKSVVTAGLARLTTPLVFAGLCNLAHTLVVRQVVLSGAMGEIVLTLYSASLFLAAAWAVWIAVSLLVEAIIASPFIPEGSYDAHLLRLVAKVGGLLAAGAVVVYGANDIGIPALGLVAGLGVGGFALALAAQSTVENLFGGVSIFADRPFRVNDFIQYGSEIGVVEAIGPRSCRVRGIDGTLTTVPNADLAKMHVINFSMRDKCLFNHVIGLRYESSPEQVEWILAEIRTRLGAHPLVEESPGYPRVRMIGFGASSLDVEVRAYVLTANWSEFLEAQEALLLDLMKIVERGGSSFAFPSQTVYFGRDGGLDETAKRRAELLSRGLPHEPSEHPDNPGGPEDGGVDRALRRRLKRVTTCLPSAFPRSRPW